MRVLKILKDVLMVGGNAVPAIVSAIHPVAGNITSLIVNSVVQAEAKFGSGNGAAKKNYVLEGIQLAAPLILQIAEQASGRELADDEKFVQAVDKLIDGYVDMLNSFQVLPKQG